LPQLTLQ